MCATERVVPQFKYATEGKHDQRREQSEDGNVSALREDRLGNQQGNTGFGVADTILTVANRQRHRGHDQTRWDFVAPLLRTCLQRAY